MENIVITNNDCLNFSETSFKADKVEFSEIFEINTAKFFFDFQGKRLHCQTKLPKKEEYMYQHIYEKSEGSPSKCNMVLLHLHFYDFVWRMVVVNLFSVFLIYKKNNFML